MRMQKVIIGSLIIFLQLNGMQHSAEELTKENSPEQLYKLDKDLLFKLIHSTNREVTKKLINEKEVVEKAIKIQNNKLGIEEESGIKLYPTAQDFKEELEIKEKLENEK